MVVCTYQIVYSWLVKVGGSKMLSEIFQTGPSAQINHNP